MENKALKFNPNLPTEVELTFDEPKTGEGKFGTWYLYGIKLTVKGENGFFATEILNDKLQVIGVKSGSKLIITKVVKDEKTTWDIRKVGEDQPKEVSIDDSPEVIDEVKTELTLEQKVNILWSEHDKKQPKNIKNDLPF